MVIVVSMLLLHVRLESEPQKYNNGLCLSVPYHGQYHMLSRIRSIEHYAHHRNRCDRVPNTSLASFCILLLEKLKTFCFNVHRGHTNKTAKSNAARGRPIFKLNVQG